MIRQVLNVIIVDDDGLGVREDVFRRYFQHEAEKAEQRLVLSIYTEFPLLENLVPADIISWDNDLGGNSETIRHLRRMQYITSDTFEQVLKNKTHIIHSMNEVATTALFQLFAHDLMCRTHRIPFNYMRDAVSNLHINTSGGTHASGAE